MIWCTYCWRGLVTLIELQEKSTKTSFFMPSCGQRPISNKTKPQELSRVFDELGCFLDHASVASEAEATKRHPCERFSSTPRSRYRRKLSQRGILELSNNGADAKNDVAHPVKHSKYTLELFVNVFFGR